jgi:hypothetical protein
MIAAASLLVFVLLALVITRVATVALRPAGCFVDNQERRFSC